MTSTSPDTTLTRRCADAPPSLLLRGVAEFNAGHFYRCHETLEELWRAEPEPVRVLYRGIIQLGVACYHAERGNRIGALGQFRKALTNLAAMPNVCQTVRVDRLRSATATYLAAVESGEQVAAYPAVELA